MSSPLHTGEKLERRPKTVEKLQGLIASGMGLNEAARSVHVAPQSLRAYRDRHPEFLEQVKARLEQLQVATLDSFASHVEAGTVKAESLPIAYGIFHDKYTALTSIAQPNTAQLGPDISSVLDELKQLCQSGSSITVSTQSITVSGQPKPAIAVQGDQAGAGGSLSRPGRFCCVRLPASDILP
jgi:uncharacterized protein YoaH (UPF0181 family)